MIQSKIHWVKSGVSKPNAPLLAFIPGGPGLSSQSLRSMEKLSLYYDLVFVDPPGTGGMTEVENPTYEEVIASIETELSSLKRSLVLVGHSFGGIVVADLAIRKKLDLRGVIFIGCGLTRETIEVVLPQRARSVETPEIRRAREAFLLSPSEEVYRNWLVELATIYFTDKAVAEGRKLLSEDRVSAASYLHVKRQRQETEMNLADQLRTLLYQKLLIAGELDRLFPVTQLEKDAQRAGCQFNVVTGTGHFPFVEKPADVIEIIHDFIGS